MRRPIAESASVSKGLQLLAALVEAAQGIREELIRLEEAIRDTAPGSARRIRE